VFGRSLVTAERCCARARRRRSCCSPARTRRWLRCSCPAPLVRAPVAAACHRSLALNDC
jgi:hypothetical protein